MKQFIYFLFAGGVAACLNFGSRFLFSRWVSYEIAIVFAYLVGMLTAFVLMRQHVFKARGRALLPQVLKFALVNVFALLQTLGISVALVRWVFPAWGLVAHAEALAHLVGVLTPVISSYFGHKLLTFK